MTFWALPGCPHLYPQERWGCHHGDDLRVFIRQDLPSAREESQYKGAICPHLLLVTGPSGIWGQLGSGHGAARSPPYLHPGMQLGCIVSWASRAALLVPPAAGLLSLELGRGRHGANLHLETGAGKGGPGDDGWAERKGGGGRREATGVVLCPWERYVDVGSSHPWEL